MIAKDENALMCDFAETYGIYDIYKHPPKMIAIYAIGLGEDSRIKCVLSDVARGETKQLLAAIYDLLSIMVWQRTKAAEKGRNKPKSLYERFINKRREVDADTVAVNTIEEFKALRQRIIGASDGN